MAQLSRLDPAPGSGHDDGDDEDSHDDADESLVFAVSNSSFSHPYFSSYNNSSSSEAEAEAAGGTLEWLAPRLSFSRDFARSIVTTAGGAAAESVSISDKSEESDIVHMMSGCCPNGSGSPPTQQLLTPISNSSCKGSPTEFEFSKSTTVIPGQEHSAVHDLQYPCMLAADELFSDGKLRPLYSKDSQAHLQNNTNYNNSVRSITSEESILANWSMKTSLHAYCSEQDVTMQLYTCHGSAGTTTPEQVSYNYMGYSASSSSGADIMRTELAQHPISPKAPTCTSRWKELLGLKKVQIHEYNNNNNNNNNKHSRSELSSRGTDNIKLMMRKGMRSSDPQLLAPGRRSLDSVTDLKAHVTATAAVGVNVSAALEASDSLISAGNFHNHHQRHIKGAGVGSISPSSSALFLCSSSTHDQCSQFSDPANAMLQPDPELCPTTSLMMVRQQQQQQAAQSSSSSSSSSWDMSGSRSSKSSDDSEGMINTMELHHVQKTVNVGIGASVKHRNNNRNSNNLINTSSRARSPGICEQMRVTRPGAAKSATASSICNVGDEGLLSASPGRSSVDSRSSGAGKAINCSSLAAETSDSKNSSVTSSAAVDSRNKNFNKNVADTRQQQHFNVRVRGLDRSYGSPKPLKRRSNHQQALLKSGGVAHHHGNNNRPMRSSSSSSASLSSSSWSSSGIGACEYLHHGSHPLNSRSLERSTSYSAAAAVRVTPVMYITPGFRKASKINGTMFNGLTHLFSSKKDKPAAEQLH